MENCLVTRYLASVENENLPFFNAIIVKILAGKSNILQIVPSATIKRISGDGFINTDKTEGTFTNSATLSGGTNGTSYIVYGLGALTKFGFNENYSWAQETYEIDINGIKDCINLKEVDLMSGNGGITNAKLSVFSEMKSLQILSITFSRISGSFSDITMLTDLEEVKANGCEIGGNIGELVSLRKLTRLEISSNLSATGTIESLADGLKNYRTSGSTLVIITNEKITYGGNTFTNGTTKTITFDGSGGYSVA
jgi:hypothetical protein